MLFGFSCTQRAMGKFRAPTDEVLLHKQTKCCFCMYFQLFWEICTAVNMCVWVAFVRLFAFHICILKTRIMQLPCCSAVGIFVYTSLLTQHFSFSEIVFPGSWFRIKNILPTFFLNLSLHVWNSWKTFYTLQNFNGKNYEQPDARLTRSTRRLSCISLLLYYLLYNDILYWYPLILFFRHLKNGLNIHS